MFKRLLAPQLLARALSSPVLAILGPRQSGKTTLARTVFNNHAYVSLENFQEREFAQQDPQRFLSAHNNAVGIIIDEVQHVPNILSYIQTYVDETQRMGEIILTGSQNIMMSQTISQTLAGRIALFTLLPFSIQELKESNNLPSSLEEQLLKGGYPRIYAHHIDPTQWYLDYIETYVERDVRFIGNISDLATFRRFMKLCAGRIGQILNITSLANDCGIDQRTAKGWLSVLQASYVLFLLEPHYENFNKRVIKSPKLYFYDTGVACALLGIQSVQQCHEHYLRGGLVESALISDILKHYYNHGQRPHDVYFWRDQTGHEIDCVIRKNNKLVPIEIKAANTIVPDFFKGLKYWQTINPTGERGYVVYSGANNQDWSQGMVIGWQNIENIF